MKDLIKYIKYLVVHLVHNCSILNKFLESQLTKYLGRNNLNKKYIWAIKRTQLFVNNNGEVLKNWWNIAILSRRLDLPWITYT